MPPPVGLYVRPGRNDHLLLQQLLIEGRAPTGLVFDARFGDRHKDLREAAVDVNLDAVADANAQGLWSPLGRTLFGIDQLPWTWVGDAGDSQLWLTGGDQLASALADYVAHNHFGSVLAPTHFVSGVDDRRLDLDLSLARRLRAVLDQRGLQGRRIYYPLSMPATALGTAEERATLLRKLRNLDVDSVWLRLHPFGTTSSGPLALRRYIAICRDLQSSAIPLVAERTGTVGVLLLSVQAVGGIECGVTLGERFDAKRLTRGSTGREPYSHPPRVYFAPIGEFVSRKDARDLLARRAIKAALGCPDAGCCRHGPDDMVQDPRRHGLIQRLREVNEVGNTPPHQRTPQYADYVRRGGDIASRLSSTHPALEHARRRLDSWRGTLLSISDGELPASPPQPAVGRRIAPPASIPMTRPAVIQG